MIDQVHFRNFKSLRDVTLDLGRLTVLVGPNGSGKSSSLEAIDLLSQAAQPTPADGGPHVWLRFAPLFGNGGVSPFRLASRSDKALTLPTEVGIAMRETDGEEFRLRVSILQEPPKSSNGDEYEFTLSLRGTSEPVELTATRSGMEKASAKLSEPRFLRYASAQLLKMEPSLMCETSISNEEIPYLDPSGDNLASTLAWMKGAAEENLEQLQDALAKVVPGARRIRTYRERISRQRMDRLTLEGQPVWRPVNETLVGDRFEVEFDTGVSIPADLLSEGTVLTLGLLTKLYEKHRPRLLLVDDIDRGLHIEAQSKLVDVLRQLLVVEKDLQIVCTTHSPHLLDRFKPEEVRVFGLDADRFSQVRRLTEHPEYEQWKYGNQTGELWSALGSGWVAKQPAHHE